MTPALRDKLDRCRTLPAPPALALLLQRLTERADFGIADVARTLSGDPAMPPRVLRLVNAPLLGIKREVTSLQQALMFLGAMPACNWGIALSLTHDLRKGERPGFDHDWFWRRALLSGLAMQALAKGFALPRTDELFIAALLQDIGMLALAHAVPEYSDHLNAGRAMHDHLLETERNDIGGSHAEISAWMLQRWRFPAPLRDLAVWCHPAEAPVPKRSDEKLVRSLAVCGLVADLWVSPDRGKAVQAVLARGKEWLGLDAKGIGQVVSQIAAALPEAASIFEITFPPDEELAITTEEIHAQLGGGPVTPRPLVLTPLPLSAGVTDALDEPARERLISKYDPQLVGSLLARMCEEATRGSKPLAIALCDIDSFSALNARYGNEGGDRVLKAVGHWLRMRLRGRDVAMRFDGAGFLLALVDTPVTGAEIVTERMRKELEITGFDAGGGRTLSVTMSVGCAGLDAALPGALELLAAVNQALRMAKQAGRNRVVVGGATKRGAA